MLKTNKLSCSSRRLILKNYTNKTSKNVQEDTKGKKIIKPIKILNKNNVPGKTKGKEILKTKQDSKQKTQKKSEKDKKREYITPMNNGSEIECGGEGVSYADSSSHNDFPENPCVNDRWDCFDCQSEKIMTMGLCR